MLLPDHSQHAGTTTSAASEVTPPRWPTPADFYKTVVGFDRRHGKTGRAPTQRMGERDAVPDWIYETVLVVDLDQTLIQPSPVFGPRPTAFPLLAEGEIQVQCQLGRRYLIRSGLEDLGKILSFPWRATVLLSRSRQAKVNEVARKIRIASKPLADRMDVCAGAEVLYEFAARQGAHLSFHKGRSLTNPAGRPAKAKPSEFVFLADLRSLGAALRDGDESRAVQIVRDSALQPCCSLLVDDQPYYEPRLDTQACYRVLPFTRIEHFKPLCELSLPAAPLQFSFLDFIWRASAASFSYLDFLLRRNLTWPEFVERLNLPIQLANCLRRRGSWAAIRRRHCLEEYLQHVAERRLLDERLLQARYSEHAKVYQRLKDYIVADVKHGWRVLLLGRDMDYVFDAIRCSFPNLVATAKVVSLPLSRAAISGMNEDLLLRLMLNVLRLRRAGDRGLLIYDVGYHGTVPSFIKRALKRRSSPKIKRVEVRLLNVCDCSPTPQDCPRKAITFADWQGDYTLSREFGISIERCPHTKGRLESVLKKSRGFSFRYARHSSAETRAARALQKRMVGISRSRGARNENGPALLRRVAKDALSQIVKDNPSFLRQIRQTWQGFYDCGQKDYARSIRTVVYPFCGLDLLTPLLCFPALARLVLIDRMPVRMSPTRLRVDAASAVSYLAHAASHLNGDPAFTRQGVFCAGPHFNHSLHRSHALALLCAPLLWSLASVLPLVTVKRIPPRRQRRQASLAWLLQMESRRPIRLEYHAVGFRNLSSRLFGRLNGLLLNTRSALILRGFGHGGNEADLSRLRTLAGAAELLVHDDRLGLDVGGEARRAAPLIPLGDCLDVITSPEEPQGQEPGNCYVRVNRGDVLSRPQHERRLTVPFQVPAYDNDGSRREEPGLEQQLAASHVNKQ